MKRKMLLGFRDLLVISFWPNLITIAMLIVLSESTGLSSFGPWRMLYLLWIVLPVGLTFTCLLADATLNFMLWELSA